MPIATDRPRKFSCGWRYLVPILALSGLTTSCAQAVHGNAAPIRDSKTIVSSDGQSAILVRFPNGGSGGALDGIACATVGSGAELFPGVARQRVDGYSIQSPFWGSNGRYVMREVNQQQQVFGTGPTSITCTAATRSLTSDDPELPTFPVNVAVYNLTPALSRDPYYVLSELSTVQPRNAARTDETPNGACEVLSAATTAATGDPTRVRIGPCGSPPPIPGQRHGEIESPNAVLAAAHNDRSSRQRRTPRRSG